MKKLGEIFNNLRKRALRKGYACDDCGREIFDYPHTRLCAECEGKLLLPKLSCEKCGREKVADGLCADCKASPPAFTRGISPFVYRTEGAALVNRLKNGKPRLAAYFGEKMAEAFLQEYGEREETLLILPVPATKESALLRGYNQAELLAESVADYLQARGVAAELETLCLEKGRDTHPQKRMSRKERAENVAGAYLLRKRKLCEGRVILLVDDVMTTGATGNECARKLLAAKAKEVIFLTAAAVPERK